MVDAIKWIANAIKILSTLNVNDVENRNSHATLTKKLSARNANANGKIFRFNVEMHDRLTNCSKKNARSSYCDLHQLVNENKTVLEEFIHRPADRTSPPANYISVLTYSNNPTEKYACAECYYRQQLITLVELLPAISIEVEIPMTALNRKEIFYLQALKTNEVVENKKTKILKSILGFSYTVKEKVKDSANEVDVKKYAIISKFQKSLKLLHLEQDSNNFLVNKNIEVPYVASINMQVEMFPLDSIFYINELNTLINLGARYNTTTIEAFEIAGNLGNITANVREVINKVKKVDNKKKQIVPKTETTAAASSITSSISSSISSLNSKMKLSSLGNFTYVLLFLIALVSLYLFHKAFKVDQNDLPIQRPDRPKLL